MSSRIRGRRYRNEDPDERYGFASHAGSVATTSEGPANAVFAVDPASHEAAAIRVEPAIPIEPVEAATVLMDGTAVTVEPTAVILESRSVVLGPPGVTGPSQAEG